MKPFATFEFTVTGTNLDELKSEAEKRVAALASGRNFTYSLAIEPFVDDQAGVRLWSGVVRGELPHLGEDEDQPLVPPPAPEGKQREGA